eukprot:scaffold257999_cov32-Tisochrysis_lutea.AAC.2
MPGHGFVHTSKPVSGVRVDFSGRAERKEAKIAPGAGIFACSGTHTSAPTHGSGSIRASALSGWSALPYVCASTITPCSVAQ